jgi:xanthine dehydrogenase accessory factor
MDRRETRDILDALGEARRAGRRAALATVVRVQGSAYRREGVRMLVREDGALTCMLSGGCLELEVAEVAKGVLRSGTPALRHYDLAEDVVWGLGLGCGGTVDIYIEPVDGSPFLDDWLDTWTRGDRAVLATPLSDPTGRTLFTAEGDARGSTRDPALDRAVAGAANEILSAPYPRAETRSLSGGNGPADVFFDVAGPPPELILFGAGHDAIPLAAHAQRLGWDVTVVDARAAFTTPDRFPGSRLVVAHPSQFEAQVRIGTHAFVMVMNHHLERDQAALAFALRSEAAWIGVLGPRARYLKLLGGLASDGAAPTPAQLARVRNPVGLDIGAESPEEVALAIVGGLLAERRGFEGGPLDGVTGRIHDPRAR